MQRLFLCAFVLLVMTACKGNEYHSNVMPEWSQPAGSVAHGTPFNP